MPVSLLLLIVACHTPSEDLAWPQPTAHTNTTHRAAAHPRHPYLGPAQCNSLPNQHARCQQQQDMRHLRSDLLQVRAAVAVKLWFCGEEGTAAAAMPPSRAFRGAVQVTYQVGAELEEYRAMAALLRHAADTWPYITSATLECDPNCQALSRWAPEVLFASAEAARARARAL